MNAARLRSGTREIRHFAPFQPIAQTFSKLRQVWLRVLALLACVALGLPSASLNTGRLSHLVEELVSLVQAEAQQIRLSLRRVNLTQLTASVIAAFALEAAVEASVPAITIADRAAGSASLLLVEDHPELAAYLAERLAEYCPVIVAANAEHAWQQLHQNTISIVVSDVVRPGHSGIELCKRIKTNPELADTPVLLISARAGKADRQSGLDAGAFDWLTKPFSLDTLLSRVQRAWPEFDRLARAIDAVELNPTAPELAPIEENGQTSTQRLDRILDIALSQLSHATFGVPEWSERAHLSERQLRRRVTELTGMAPVAWLREQRLLNVRALITSAACSTLAEAGTRAGIDNAGYLYRLYRARFGSD